MEYKNIVEKFKDAKLIGSIEVAQEAIFFFLKIVKSIVSDTSDYRKLAKFSFDENKVFFSKIQKISLKSADLQLISNGLLYELLKKCSIVNAKEISDGIEYSIECLHVAMSSESNDIDKVRESTLKTIEHYSKKLSYEFNRKK